LRAAVLSKTSRSTRAAVLGTKEKTYMKLRRLPLWFILFMLLRFLALFGALPLPCLADQAHPEGPIITKTFLLKRTMKILRHDPDAFMAIEELVDAGSARSVSGKLRSALVAKGWTALPLNPKVPHPVLPGKRTLGYYRKGAYYLLEVTQTPNRARIEVVHIVTNRPVNNEFLPGR